MDPALIFLKFYKRASAFQKAFGFFLAGLRPGALTPLQKKVLASLDRACGDFVTTNENLLPLAPCPVFLFPGRMSLPPALFSIFWQPLVSDIDRYLLLDNYYLKKPTPSIWWGIFHFIPQLPKVSQHFFLWDFANRELFFWTNFYRHRGHRNKTLKHLYYLLLRRPE